jgi:hypothetical protein
MKNVMRSLGFAVLAALIGYGAWAAWPTEEKRIRKAILGMADDATFTGREGNFAKLAKVESLSGRFAVDADIRVEQVVNIDAGLHGRESIRQVLTAGLPLIGSMSVEVHDLQVEVGDEPTAKAKLTASAKAGGGKGDLSAQEFELDLTKVEGKWLIRRLEAVLGYRKPVIQ